MLSELIPEAARRRIRHFVDEVFLPRAVMITPGGPPDMIDGSPNASGWRPWKPVENPVTDADILEIEQVIGASLPPLFRAWLMYKCLLLTDFGILSLPETPSDDPLGAFWVYVQILDDRESWARPRRVVPFGSDGNGVGPLCFDLNHPLPDGDYPVLLFDHELFHRPEYMGRPFCDSFASLLDMVEASLLSYDAQGPHREEQESTAPAIGPLKWGGDELKFREAIRHCLRQLNDTVEEAITRELAMTFDLGHSGRLQFEVDPIYYGIHLVQTEEVILNVTLLQVIASEIQDAAEAAGFDLHTACGEELFPWFADRWHAAGGPQHHRPAYAFYHGGLDEPRYHLEQRRWCSVEEVWPE
jgi:SMI1 / KNR4 family (SUKH-1)